MTPAQAAVWAGGLFPPSVAVAGSGPCDPSALHPAERAGIAQAVDARQREFAGGRMAVRMALAALGLDPVPVPMGPDRAPVWPAGVRGTITHAAGLCLAAVTADPGIAGLGLDLEPDAPLPPEVLGEVLQAADDPTDPGAVFCAKEAVFKALYPQVQALFGFDAVAVSLIPGGFRARVLHPLGPVPAGRVLHGRLTRAGGLRLAALTV